MNSDSEHLPQQSRPQRNPAPDDLPPDQGVQLEPLGPYDCVHWLWPRGEAEVDCVHWLWSKQSPSQTELEESTREGGKGV